MYDDSRHYEKKISFAGGPNENKKSSENSFENNNKLNASTNDDNYNNFNNFLPNPFGGQALKVKKTMSCPENTGNNQLMNKENEGSFQFTQLLNPKKERNTDSSRHFSWMAQSPKDFRDLSYRLKSFE